MRRSKQEIAKIKKACKVVVEIQEEIKNAAKAGVTTKELDIIAAKVIEHRSARSNFLNYHGFPDTICTSPNNMIVHGIPGSYMLKEGDILSVDCGAIVEGYHGDGAFTMPIGEVTPTALRLMEITEQALAAGIDSLYEGNRLHEVGRAIQNVVEAAGFSVVREYVGHGIGTAMHEDPQVPNYWPGKPGPKLKSGQVFAIEPMVNVGGWQTRRLSDGWSVVTLDGTLSAHFEHTVAIGDDGPEILTLP